MTVILTKNIKKRTKNFLKRWFVEPKANVFVGNIDFDRIELIIRYIHSNIKDDFNAIIIATTNTIQKYKIIEIGNQKLLTKKKIKISGIELLID
jgi:CRISPR-associated endoribonuclease Cas2 subtype I-E